jgi:uncharacterized SAM-binding protein YcdF (DUF218 family)
MATSANSVLVREKKTRRNQIAIALIVLLIAAAVAGFRSAGEWLVREDAAAPADVIVVLSGGMPYRAEGAAALYAQGLAHEVWVSRPELPAEDLELLGVHFVGEEEYNRQILVKEGVPGDAIHIFPETIVDSEQEIEETVREMRRTGKSRAIIVTSPPHTRRVKALWRSLAGNEPSLIVRAAYEDPFDAGHWWRNTRDSLSVVREYLGLLNVWAGMPVRPHAR